MLLYCLEKSAYELLYAVIIFHFCGRSTFLNHMLRLVGVSQLLMTSSQYQFFLSSAGFYEQGFDRWDKIIILY